MKQYVFEGGMVGAGENWAISGTAEVFSPLIAFLPPPPPPPHPLLLYLYFAVFCCISLYFSPFNFIAFLRPHPTQRPTQLIYISDIYLFRLFRYLDYLDDQHRNTNMNDKDHLVGQLTNTHQDLIRDSRARP